MEHAWTTVENEHKQSINLKLNDVEEVGDGGEGARGGRRLAKALGGRAHHLLQPVDVFNQQDLSFGVAARSIAAVSSKRSQHQQARRNKGQAGRSLDRCSSRRTQTNVTSSWAAVWRAVTAEAEHTAVDHTKLEPCCQNRKKTNAGPSRPTSCFFPDQMCSHNFPDPGSTRYEHRPLSLFSCFRLFFSETLYSLDICPPDLSQLVSEISFMSLSLCRLGGLVITLECCWCWLWS